MVDWCIQICCNIKKNTKKKMSIEQFAIYSSARDAEKNSNRGGKPSTGIAGSSYRTASRQLSNFLIPEVARTKNIETKKYRKEK